MDTDTFYLRKKMIFGNALYECCAWQECDNSLSNNNESTLIDIHVIKFVSFRPSNKNRWIFSATVFCALHKLEHYTVTYVMCWACSDLFMRSSLVQMFITISSITREPCKCCLACKRSILYNAIRMQSEFHHHREKRWERTRKGTSTEKKILE